MSGFVIRSCISAGTTCKCNETEGEIERKSVKVKESKKERLSEIPRKKKREAALLEEMRVSESVRVDREMHGERESKEESRHLEGSGHTCHIPFI